MSPAQRARHDQLLKGVAVSVRTYFNELLLEGFAVDQALLLSSHYQSIAFMSEAHRSDFDDVDFDEDE